MLSLIKYLLFENIYDSEIVGTNRNIHVAVMISKLINELTLLA